jgi:hypothetical protein
VSFRNSASLGRTIVVQLDAGKDVLKGLSSILRWSDRSKKVSFLRPEPKKIVMPAQAGIQTSLLAEQWLHGKTL